MRPCVPGNSLFCKLNPLACLLRCVCVRAYKLSFKSKRSFFSIFSLFHLCVCVVFENKINAASSISWKFDRPECRYKGKFLRKPELNWTELADLESSDFTTCSMAIFSECRSSPWVENALAYAQYLKINIALTGNSGRVSIEIDFVWAKFSGSSYFRNLLNLIRVSIWIWCAEFFSVLISCFLLWVSNLRNM